MLDIAQFLHDWLVPCLAIVLAGCGVLLTRKLSGWIDTHAGWLSQDQKAKALSLEKDAYNRGVNWLLNQVQTKVERIQIHPENPLIRQAVQIVLNHPASILGKPEDIAAQIVAQLPAYAVAPPPGAQVEGAKL